MRRHHRRHQSHLLPLASKKHTLRMGPIMPGGGGEMKTLVLQHGQLSSVHSLRDPSPVPAAGAHPWSPEPLTTDCQPGCIWTPPTLRPGRGMDRCHSAPLKLCQLVPQHPERIRGPHGPGVPGPFSCNSWMVTVSGPLSPSSVGFSSL